MWDEETELYYLRGRYYNVVHSRFINTDAMLCKAVGYNQYAYCKNNPIMLIDRSGNLPKLFYFYGGDQQGHAEANSEDLEDDYEIHGHLIESADGFVESWEDMYEQVGGGNIDIVIMKFTVLLMLSNAWRILLN